MHLESHAMEHRLMRIRRRARASCAGRPRADFSTPSAAPIKHSEPPPSASAAAEADLPTEAARAGHALEGCRRRSARVTVSGDVGVRRLGSFNFQAMLQDVSTGGCRVELLEPCEVGDRVVARFAQLEPFGARVRWSAGTTGGLEFIGSMHPAVFDMLLIRLTRRATSQNQECM